MVAQLCTLARVLDCACLDVYYHYYYFNSWVLNEIWIIDLSSALNGMLLFLFSKLIELRCETVLGLAYIFLCEINNGIHIHWFTFELLYTSVSGGGCGFGFEQKYW